jgi:hypothetical protein
MSREKQLIRREFLARKELLVGTVIGSIRPDRFDDDQPGAGVMWVVDIEIGSNRPLLNVPVKSAGDGGRFYANLGQTVLLRRSLLGRYMVVGPGDRVSGQLTTTEYDLTTEGAVASSALGFSAQVDPFEFYMGARSMKGNPSVTFDNQVGDDRLDRATGSFTDDGFLPGQSVRITSPLNTGTFSINTVGALTLSFIGDPFVDEGPLTGVRIGVTGTSRWSNGVDGFPSRRILNAQGVRITPS